MIWDCRALEFWITKSNRKQIFLNAFQRALKTRTHTSAHRLLICVECGHVEFGTTQCKREKLIAKEE